MSATLDVRGLRIAHDDRTVVSGLDLRVAPGESVGIVGESGSGKSVTAKAIMGLLPGGFRTYGEIHYGDRELLSGGLRGIRGRKIALIMQDPFTILNPVMRCGDIIAESLPRGGRRERRAEAVRRLAEVGIADPAVARRYPFQLSGGMRQRVAIAAALAADPELLIADEPSTALDAVTQREILDLIKGIQRARGMALILITHDLRVAFSVCDRIAVLYAGSLVETGPAAAFADEPLHPYSQGLLLAEPPIDRRVSALVPIPGSVPAHDEVAGRCPFAPRCRWSGPECESTPPLVALGDDRRSACVRLPEIRPRMAEFRTQALRDAPAEPSEPEHGTPLVTVADLRKEFRGGAVALHGVSLTVGAGESVGIIGESGSGKTTLARTLIGLERPTAGTITWSPGPSDSALPIDSAPRAASSSRGGFSARDVQMVFQDPYSTLNPMRTVGATLAEALAVAGFPARDVPRLLESVGLPAAYARRRPAALSGGERQRVAIARAIAVRPKLLILDEPVSALDVSVQAQILGLLADLRAERGLAYLFITHDLAVVRQITDRVYVFHHGRIVESGPTATVLDAPRDPYTRLLKGSS